MKYTLCSCTYVPTRKTGPILIPTKSRTFSKYKDMEEKPVHNERQQDVRYAFLCADGRTEQVKEELCIKNMNMKTI